MDSVTESHSSLAPGLLFAGRYKIERLLGEGGMGSVYLAEDTMFEGEKVALKVLHSHLSKDTRHSKRFLREVQLTRKLSHPNVVRTYDVGTFGENLFFTMEYIEGQSLKDRIVDGNLSPYEVPYILAEISAGLSAVHQIGIIHRDLKPGNVILDSQGGVKITDFGVARTGCSDLTGTSEIVGSVTYVAPEVWLGKEVSGSCDLYALGVMSYQMLTNILPFDGDTPAEVMCKHLESKPTPPNQLNDVIQPWLNHLVMSLLEKDPADRPKSAQEVRSIIDAHRSGSHSSAAQFSSQINLDRPLYNGNSVIDTNDEPLEIESTFIKDTFIGAPPDLKPEDTMVTPTAEFAQTLAKVRAKRDFEKRKSKQVLTRTLMSLGIGSLVFLADMFVIDDILQHLFVSLQGNYIAVLAVIAYAQLLNISAVLCLPIMVGIATWRNLSGGLFWWASCTVALASLCAVLSFMKVDQMIRFKNEMKQMVVGSNATQVQGKNKNAPFLRNLRCKITGDCPTRSVDALLQERMKNDGNLPFRPLANRPKETQ